MASLYAKVAVSAARRNILCASRCFATRSKHTALPEFVHQEFPITPTRRSKRKLLPTMGDPVEHATGLEKRELLAKAAGNDDPFDLKVIKRGAGTKAKPNEIPSAFDARLVGCICEEEATCVSWMWLHKGQPRRCECGHWFSLVHKDAL